MYIWGADAQKRMMEGIILLVNINSINTEISKNLVLAGINVHLLDNNNVTTTDTQNNFIYNIDDIGKQKSNVVEKKLLDMNPLVKNLKAINRQDKNILDIISDNINTHK